MKPYIKNALMVALTFFAMSIIVTFVCAMLFMMYTICTHLVSGQTVTAFDRIIFIEGLLSVAPIVLMMSSVFMIMYMIRHPLLHWLPLVIYAVLYILAWSIFIPAIFTLEKHFEQQGIMSTVDYGHLSSDYFRQYEDLVIFYSRVERDNLASGVCIDVNATYDTTYSFSNVRLPVSEGGFVDNLVKSSVGLSPVVALVIGCIYNLMETARFFMLNGYANWLAFASFGLALMSVVGLRRISRWRIVNLTFVLFFTSLIVVMNVLSFVPSFLTGFETFMNGLLKKVFNFANPILFIMNSFIALALFLTGLLIDIFNHSDDAYLSGGSL